MATRQRLPLVAANNLTVDREDTSGTAGILTITSLGSRLRLVGLGTPDVLDALRLVGERTTRSWRLDLGVPYALLVDGDVYVRTDHATSEDVATALHLAAGRFRLRRETRRYFLAICWTAAMFYSALRPGQTVGDLVEVTG